MSGRRVQKVAEAIREVVSMAILTEMQDPRVKNVTVTYVEVSADLRLAKVHVSIMGDEKKQKLALYGLEHAAGFLQSKVGDRVQMRYTPKLQFFIDLGVKHSIEIARILKEVLPVVSAAEAAEETDEFADLAGPQEHDADEDVATSRLEHPTPAAHPPPA